MLIKEEEEEEKEEEEDEEDEDGKHGQNVEIIFLDIKYILHHNTTNFCILYIFNAFFLILLKVKSTLNFK